jgi:hypothetical protein
VTPDEVPAELVQEATQAFAATVKATWDGQGGWSITVPDDAMARALAAVLPATRKMLIAAFDVQNIARDLHTMHAQSDDGGACADCDFRAGFVLGRLMRDHT